MHSAKINKSTFFNKATITSVIPYDDTSCLVGWDNGAICDAMFMSGDPSSRFANWFGGYIVKTDNKINAFAMSSDKEAIIAIDDIGNLILLKATEYSYICSKMISSSESIAKNDCCFSADNLMIFTSDINGFIDVFNNHGVLLSHNDIANGVALTSVVYYGNNSVNYIFAADVYGIIYKCVLNSSNYTISITEKVSSVPLKEEYSEIPIEYKSVNVLSSNENEMDVYICSKAFGINVLHVDTMTINYCQVNGKFHHPELVISKKNFACTLKDDLLFAGYSEEKSKCNILD